MFLSMPREGADIIPIPDIGPIDSESDSDSEREVLELFDVQITGLLLGLPELQGQGRACNTPTRTMFKVCDVAMLRHMPGTDVR